MKPIDLVSYIGREVVVLWRSAGSLRALGGAGKWRLVGVEKGGTVAVIERRETQRIPLAAIESITEFKG